MSDQDESRVLDSPGAAFLGNCSRAAAHCVTRAVPPGIHSNLGVDETGTAVSLPEVATHSDRLRRQAQRQNMIEDNILQLDDIMGISQ